MGGETAVCHELRCLLHAHAHASGTLNFHLFVNCSSG